MAYQQDFSMDMPTPGYIVYRDIKDGQAYDPTAAPVFFPPKDSDELFDALRAKYPHVKTHSERMRDAIIEFLLEERQSELSNLATPISADTAITSPWLQTWPSMSSASASVWSSPETFSLATPSFADSPQPQSAQESRHTSFAAFSAGPTSETDLSPPALEQMTGVFSLSSSAQPKQRVRRKMTEAEKAEYRKRRIVKACDKCSKRKRKCVHNEEQMETLPTRSQGITKSQSAHTASKHVRQPPDRIKDALVDMSAFGFGNAFATDMQLFDDFTTISNEPTDELLASHQAPFDRWIGAPPADIWSGDFGMASESVQQSWLERSYTSEMSSSSLGSSNSAVSMHTFDGLQQQQAGPNFEYNDVLNHEPMANGLQQAQWLPTEKPQPTHTAHVHAQQGGMAGLDVMPSPPCDTVDKVVMRMLGTRRALAAFSRLLPSRFVNQGRPLRLEAVAFAIGASALSQRMSSPIGVSALESSAQNGVGLLRHRTAHIGRSVQSLPSRLPIERPSTDFESNEPPNGEERPLPGDLGNLIRRAPSPRLELYRLRQRADRNTWLSYPRLDLGGTLHATTSEGLSASQTTPLLVRANGGAYPRLETGDALRASPRERLSASSDAPVLFRPQYPTGSGNTSETDRARSIATAKSPGVLAVTAGSSGLGSHATANEALVSRLCDHFRRRDHFGRLAVAGGRGLAVLLAALGGLLLLSSVLAGFANVDASLLVLALVLPVSSVKDTRARCVGSPRQKSATGHMDKLLAALSHLTLDELSERSQVNLLEEREFKWWSL